MVVVSSDGGNGDGPYEDTEGDGNFTYTDVVVVFEHPRDPEARATRSRTTSTDSRV